MTIMPITTRICQSVILVLSLYQINISHLHEYAAWNHAYSSRVNDAADVHANSPDQADSYDKLSFAAQVMTRYASVLVI
jgi:hypothetical protein